MPRDDRAGRAQPRVLGGSGLRAARTPAPAPPNANSRQAETTQEKGRPAGSEAQEGKHKLYFINPNLLLHPGEAANSV